MQRVLVTGFPGFIAGMLLERLSAGLVEVNLLVESRFAEAARTRADAIATSLGLPPERFRIEIGDITREGLGLEAQAAERLQAEVDTVFHLAAVYDLAVPEAIAQKVNVEGTANVNRFVAGIANLERYNYVSTYAVAGKRSGVIREAELEHDAGFFNHYESTKYAAEVLVRALARDEGVPTSIFRPGVVVGSSKDGRTIKFDGPYMLLKVLRRLPWPIGRFNAGLPDVKFQVVPVDFIIEAMATIANKPGLDGKTFHLTDPEPISTAEIYDLFSQALDGARSWVRAPKLLTWLATTSGAAESLGLQRQAAPYFFHQATFDCVNTLDALDGTGVAVPPLASYVDKLVAFFLDHEKELEKK
ncbi:MAG TPA: SDR family oxidoreductase [Thermoanaerobaculia bacterium]|mgnify:CR=1 FL=1|nr:SDR family oxidoreductase [Thermoanaerobaculia bacterium]